MMAAREDRQIAYWNELYYLYLILDLDDVLVRVLMALTVALLLFVEKNRCCPWYRLIDLVGMIYDLVGCCSWADRRQFVR